MSTSRNSLYAVSGLMLRMRRCLVGFRGPCGLLLGAVWSLIGITTVSGSDWQRAAGNPGDWFTTSNWNAGVPNWSIGGAVSNGGEARITSGSAQAYNLTLGGTAGSSGILTLSGTGQLATPSGTQPYRGEYIGWSGAGTLNQDAGINSAPELHLGYNSGSDGTYALSGGHLSVSTNEYVGRSGSGSFNHTGGTNSITGHLYLGYNSSSSATYSLSGSGVLEVGDTEIGKSGSSGTFRQTGGSNTTGSLYASPTGTYSLTGGMLTVNRWLQLSSNSTLSIAGTGTLNTANGSTFGSGNLDFAHSTATANMGGVVDLSLMTIRDAENATLIVKPDSLLMVDSDFNPSTAFKTFVNNGSLPVHTRGTPVVIPAGGRLDGTGNIMDHVDVQGTITTTDGGNFHIQPGIYVSGSGNVNMGEGGIWITNMISGISGGQLTARIQSIGSSSGAKFVQSGGDNLVKGLGGYGEVELGYSSGESGTYVLTGGTLTTIHERIGVSGTGVFEHTGGINSTGSGGYSDKELYLGEEVGGTGTYMLGGTGQLILGSSRREYIGCAGNGTFNQTGGSNSTYGIVLGSQTGSSGTLNLDGGMLIITDSIKSSVYGIHGGSGVSTLNLNGTTIKVGKPSTTFISGVTNAYVKSGGARFDTNGNDITIAQALVAGSPSGGLIKDGSGILTLSGANTYAGDTIINGGVLKVGSANAVPYGANKGNVVLDGGASAAGTLDLAGLDVTINGLFGAAGSVSGQIINSNIGTAKTLFVGNNNATSTFGGDIKDNNGTGGTVAVTKTGSGTQTLSGTNTYTGSTSINAGLLNIIGSLANNGSNKVLIYADATGATKLTRRVLGTGLSSYAGLGSAVAGGELATKADVMAGTASGAADVSMTWRTRNEQEETQLGGGLISEILSLDGIHTNGSGTDTFLLQMTYSTDELSRIWGLSESDAIAQHWLYLGTLDGSEWTRAVDENVGGTATWKGDMLVSTIAAGDLAGELGWYGVDTTTHVAWAVLNHNSYFGVVPEPSSLILLSMGAASLLGYVSRRRKQTA